MLYAFGGLIILRLIDKNIIYMLNIILTYLLVTKIAKIPSKNYFKLFKIPLGFLVLSLIMIAISINNINYLWSLKLGNIYIGITKDSLLQVKDLSIVVISSISSAYFLMLTTPVNQIIDVLNKTKMPKLLIELTMLTYRSIFIFLEEMKNMDLSQELRFGYDNKKIMIHSVSLIITNLFTKIIIKQKDMTLALECKLYDGEFKLGD